MRCVGVYEYKWRCRVALEQHRDAAPVEELGEQRDVALRACGWPRCVSEQLKRDGRQYHAPQPSTFRLLKPSSTTASTSPLVHSPPRSALHVALWSAQWQLLAYQPAEMPRDVASCVIERGSGNCETRHES